MPRSRPPTTSHRPAPAHAERHFAVIGAGMAGLACARTLVQAGHRVTLLEQSTAVAGRMASHSTASGSFDPGVQYFTVRDPRFALALATVPGICKPWSASAVRVLDSYGRVAAAGVNTGDPHWVPTPGMDALLRHWAQPLAASTVLQTKVSRIEPDALTRGQWQLRTEGAPGAPEAQQVFSGFDAVLLAIPSSPAQTLLQHSKLQPRWVKKISQVDVAPCWTLMLAFAQASASQIGPQWNAARSTHHRVAWLARESSKPGRSTLERWTVQASAAWSLEHLEDDAARVQAKLLKAFTEITGIHAQPSHAEVRRWRYAQTTKALGTSQLWDAKTQLGVCGDWCIGHRVEDAFISGLELALAAL